MDNKKVRFKTEEYFNFYYVLALLGLFMTLIYIFFATADVIYSDYVRLVLSYIKDAEDFSPYMGLDIFTRMPINYLQRLINVKLFGYSTSFDMVLGVISLFLSSLVLANYAKNMRMRVHWYLLMLMVVFSLNKWEMLTNGSGWVHFLAFALFFWHYGCIEKEYRQEEDVSNQRSLILLPIFTILFVAGPYSGSYAVTVLLSYAYIGIRRATSKPQFFKELLHQMKLWRGRAIAVILPLLMYIFSRINSVEDHAGATNRRFMEVFSENPILFPNFFLKTFASMFVGKEMAREMQISARILHALGFLMILFYLYAIYINIRYAIVRETILPMILLVSGGFNHMIITLSRWIFLKDPLYAMSSRYALQFQVGLIGIILSLALFGRRRHKRVINEEFQKENQGLEYKQNRVLRKNKFMRIVSAVVFVSLALSQYGFYSTEWRIAKYRKEFFEERKEIAMNFEQYGDEEIKKYMQYRSVEKTKEALTILRSQKLNIFRE